MTAASFWRSDPAPLLRGFAYRARPCWQKRAPRRCGRLGLRHEDLPAGLEVRGFRQPRRDGPDRAQVGGHVLTRGPVATGGAQGEPAALVAQGDGQAVDLELRNIGQATRLLRRRRQPQALADARVERTQLVVAEGVREAEHRVPVADLGEAAAGRCAADALGRRIGGDEGRKRGLEGDELAEQGVVLGVGELRRVVLVVAAVGAPDVLGALRVAGWAASGSRAAAAATSAGSTGSWSVIGPRIRPPARVRHARASGAGPGPGSPRRDASLARQFGVITSESRIRCAAARSSAGVPA